MREEFEERILLLTGLTPTTCSDIEESFVRGGGAGGQKINKTSSKVVLTHHPTGVTVATQQTRSLAQNRKIARKLLAEQVDLHLNGEESKVRRRLLRCMFYTS